MKIIFNPLTFNEEDNQQSGRRNTEKRNNLNSVNGSGNTEERKLYQSI